MENINKTRILAIKFIEELQTNDIEARQWDKIKNFIDTQFLMEKNKSKLSCDKNALEKIINGQIW